MKGQKRPLCVMVLGMHRSGTSALAGVLGLLGTSLPKNLMRPSLSNLKGYFEPIEIVALHNEMLATLGSSWHDFRRLNPSFYSSELGRSFKEKLLAVLTSEFGNSPKFVVKDPRICRFFPLWRDVIQSFGADLRVVVVVRNPAEVARSLAERDRLSAGYSSYLWLRHVLDAEFQSRHCNRVFVHYSELVRDSWKVIKKIEKELNIELVISAANRRQAVDDFVDVTLRHHVIDDNAIMSECPDGPIIAEVYNALEKLEHESRNSGAINALDKIRHSFDGMTRRFNAGVGAELILSHDRLLDALAEKENEINKLNSRVADIGRLKTDFSAEIASLRTRQEVDQMRISRLNAMLEIYLANELRRKNEQCELERRIAELTRELDTFKSSFGRRIGKRIETLGRGLRGISGQAKVGSKLQ